MNFSNVLDNKNIVVDENGNEIYDLTESALTDADFNFTGAYRISNEYAMRPDLICKIIYGNFLKFGEFMKANQISNPFAIEPGTIILVPDSFSISSHFETITSNEISIKERIINQYIDPSKQPDTKKTAADINAYKNREKLGLPPNILDNGEQEILIENGKIVYGPNVSTKTNESKAEKEKYLQKLTNEH